MGSALESTISSTFDSSLNRRWYVAKAKPRAEHQVARILGAWQITAYLPLLERRHRLESLFPGYLFLKINVETDEYLRARSAPGVSYILGRGEAPAAVADDLIEAIRRRLDIENNLRPTSRFASGDRVVVTAGPFRDIEAIFDRTLTPRGRCLVLLEVLGHLTRVQIDGKDLAKIQVTYSS